MLTGDPYQIDNPYVDAASNGLSIVAERFKDEILTLICTPSQWMVNGATVDATQACATLRAWDNRGNKESRGSHLWDEFWTRVPTTAGPGGSERASSTKSSHAAWLS